MQAWALCEKLPEKRKLAREIDGRNEKSENQGYFGLIFVPFVCFVG